MDLAGLGRLLADRAPVGPAAAGKRANERSRKISGADGLRPVTKLALVTSRLVVLGAAITEVRRDAGTAS